jgi:Ca2+-binding RTX toxin-like protein
MTTYKLTSPSDADRIADISAAERRDGNVKPAFSRVNTDTTGDQNSPAVTALADGGWVVTWDSHTYDKKIGIYVSNGIRQQRYNADGDMVGAETAVGRHADGDQWLDGQDRPAITAFSDGGWVVTWVSSDLDNLLDQLGSEIHQLRYNAHGKQSGPETRIRTPDSNDDDHPSVSALADGGWVVTWDGVGLNGEGDVIYQQRYGAGGQPDANTETRVSTTFAMKHPQLYPSASALADGGWVVTWVTPYNKNPGIYQQRYAADGDPVGSETFVNSFLDGDVQANSAVAAFADGGWVLTWTAPGAELHQQRYAADGSAMGRETMVSRSTSGENDQASGSSVSALADGGWVVTWDDGYDIYQQRYAASGRTVGTETRVNIHTKGDEMYPSVTGLANGDWVVTWTADGQDGNGDGIYQRVFHTVDGTGAADKLKGASADDFVQGLGGKDKLYGNAGEDILIGGKGVDTLYGGKGADTFVFAPGDSGRTHATADTIHNFSKADHINLISWEDVKGYDFYSLEFIGRHAFTGSAGELHFIKEKSDTWIEADTDGNGKADFVIHLDNAVTMKQDYFDLSA